MARLYVDQADVKIAVIHSQKGVVKNLTIPAGFPYLGLSRGALIPRASLTHEFRRLHGEGTVSMLRDLPTSSWLEERGSVTGLYEQVMLQREGWATTLLMVDEDDDEDEADDRNWNRRNLAR
ncbi:hypothetical protein D3C72_1236110 [compost metagenome]